MKTTILLSFWLAVLPAATAAAAPAAGQKAAGFGAVLDKVDAVDRETLDLQAAYWAWDIRNTGRTSYAGLKAKGQTWLMKPETRDRLFAKIKELLDGGKVRALTKDEMARLNEGKQRIGLLLSPGRGDEKLIASLSREYCIDLDGRYWGNRVRAGEREILEKMSGWGITAETRQELRAAIEKYAAQEAPALTQEERYEHDACTEKLFREHDGQRAARRAEAGGGAAGGLRAKLDLIDPIQKETLKEDALYWAWRCEKVKDTGFAELKRLSERWVIKPETRDELFRLMDGNIKSGRVRALTPEEKRRLDDGRARIRAILAK